ncbi:MAG: hypothetical protein CVV27_05955 [Candidatus Melainabacteria bacterium HGW-Melainabacteria-1]|nr:MAG: hypothetical protein CVV27_05955 [Candidatus Melainabacteria bacterium HGW-Melainabacteria-1]
MHRIISFSALGLILTGLVACTPGQVANAIKTGSTVVNNATQGFPAEVKKIDTSANNTVTIKGNLDDGQVISDLSWASSSSIACFPATQNSKFRAKHLLFHTSLPPRSILKVKLIPTDTSKAMSLYAYQIGTTNYAVVPKLSSAVTCEADHINDRPVVGKTEDGTRSVSLNATTNPYNVVIGVSGNEGVSGEFTLEVTLEQ